MLKTTKAILINLTRPKSYLNHDVSVPGIYLEYMTIDDHEYEPIFWRIAVYYHRVSYVMFKYMHVLRFEFMAQFYKLPVKFEKKFELQFKACVV